MPRSAPRVLHAIINGIDAEGRLTKTALCAWLSYSMSRQAVLRVLEDNADMLEWDGRYIIGIKGWKEPAPK